MSAAQFVFQQLLLSSEGIIHALCYDRMLERKRKEQPAWLRAVCFWLLYILILSVSWLSGVRISGAVNLIFALVLTQILLQLFYQEKLQTRLFACVVLFLMQVMAEIAVSFLYTLIQGHTSVNYMEDQMIPILMVAMMLDAVFEFSASTIWRKRRGRKDDGLRISFGILGMLEIYMVFGVVGVLVFQGSFADSYLTTIGVSLITFTAFLGFFLFYQQKQYRENLLERENLHRIQNRQEAFFRELEEQERKVSFIRHDHLNVVSAALQLLYQKEEEGVETLLAEYEKRIREDGQVEKSGQEGENI